MNIKKILIIFTMDGTMHKALSLKKIIEKEKIKVDLLYFNTKPFLSSRQLKLIKNVFFVSNKFNSYFLQNYDAVIFFQIPFLFRRRIEKKAWNFKSKRPCFVALYTGFEMTPEKGYVSRNSMDIISFNINFDLKSYEEKFLKTAPVHQKCMVFSPSFEIKKKKRKLKNNIIFFTQSITPSTEAARAQILLFLIRIRKIYNLDKIYIKLRHYKDENTKHVNKEKYSYLDIAEKLNLKNQFIFIDSVDNIHDFKLCVSCSSTASFEALAQGIPAIFLTNYFNCKKDQTYNNFHKVFKEKSVKHNIFSNKINFTLGDKTWYSEFFNKPNLHLNLLKLINNFKNTPPNDIGPYNFLNHYIYVLLDFFWLLKNVYLKKFKKLIIAPKLFFIDMSKNKKKYKYI